MPRSRHPEAYPIIFHQIAENVGELMQTLRIPAEGPMQEETNPHTGETIKGKTQLLRIVGTWNAFIVALRRESENPVWAAMLEKAKRVKATVNTQEVFLTFTHVESTWLARSLENHAFTDSSGAIVAGTADPSDAALAALEAKLAGEQPK